MPLKTSFDWRAPTHLVYGPGSIKRLPELVPSKRCLVVTDSGLKAAGIVDHVCTQLKRGKIDYVVYDKVVGNPPARCVRDGNELYTSEKCNGIVGLGGGSSMDVAKMIGVLAANGGRIESYVAPAEIKKSIPHLVCVPTTYGTGSEVTPFAVVTNKRRKTKDPVVGGKIIPSVGILDAELSVALPAILGGSTGMDALTHALESYINLLATPITEAVALGAIELIGENLRLACANDHELEATQNMLNASAMAALAFSQTRLGIVHAMSHPVGGHFDVHHGMANAILLPVVCEYNLTSRLGKFAQIADALGADTDGLTEYEAAHVAIDTILELNRDVGIPERLSQVGVKAAAVAAMAKDSMLSANIAVNPRKVDEIGIRQLYKNAL
jgi:alcohol dehydrogenase